MVRVKICGITRVGDLQNAIDAGADAVGFIVGFPSSPRNLKLDVVAKLITSVPLFVDSVIVTDVETLRKDLKKVADISPSVIQLHGEEPKAAELGERLGVKMIKVVQMGAPGLQRGFKLLKGYDAILTDSHVNGMHGGTGQTSDWNACRKLKESVYPIPFILSGGLNPENVGAAIRLVKPYAVDASSGLETSPGIKDRAKVVEFVRRAKKAA